MSAIFGACGHADVSPHVAAKPPLSADAAIPKDASDNELKSGLAYPKARRTEVYDRLFGVDVADPYRWLEDGQSSEVTSWADAQDHFARSYLRQLNERESIASRLRELSYVEAMQAPRVRGGRYFFARKEAKAEKWVVYVRDPKTKKDEVLLDPNTWSADGSVALGSWIPSWEGKLIAYQVRNNNSDEATLKVMDVQTHKILDSIEGAKWADPQWAPEGGRDGLGFFYARLPMDPAISPADRPGHAHIRFHKVGTDPNADPVIREPVGDPKTFLFSRLSRDGRWLFAAVAHGWSRTDLYYQDRKRAAGGAGVWTTLTEGEDAQFDVVVHRDAFYLVTNASAPKYRVLRVDSAHPERAAWREIVPERKDATLVDLEVVGGRLSLLYMKDVASKLELCSLDGAPIREVALPAIGTARNLVGMPDSDEAFLTFTSFTYPTEIYSMSVRTGEQKLWYKLHTPVDPSKFVVEQAFATSKDGTRIPMFIVHGRDWKKGEPAPTVLYGYGGFQLAITPTFSSSIFPWLERGGIYVVANIRGGNEYGEEWHRGGMLRQKQNVFDDFIASAEYLIHERYTDADKLVVRGASNGGLLIGAVIVQRPDLFRAGIAEVPLLDMIRYHRFGSGKTWIEEYGSADNEVDFKNLLAYSPYHHIKDGTKYPALLLLSADNDDRVDPMHARKFAAAMQHASSGGPVFLRVERHAGHGGADLVRATVERMADSYSFALASVRSARP